MSHSDEDYFRRRQADEQRRADAAARPEIRRVHQEFADRYGTLIQGPVPVSPAAVR